MPSRLSLLCAFPLAWLLLVPSAALAEDPERGLTVELGVTGVAMTDASRTFYGVSAIGTPYPYSSPDVFVGVALPSVSAGYFVHRLLSVELRIANFGYYADAETVLNGFYGAVAQLWPLPFLYAGAGLGLATIGPTPVLSYEENPEGAAFGTVLRGGVLLRVFDRYHVGVAGELFPTFGQNGESYSGAVIAVARYL